LILALGRGVRVHISFFYKNIKEDIAFQTPLLLDLEEQEDCLQTKLDRFTTVLSIGEAKIHVRGFKNVVT